MPRALVALAWGSRSTSRVWIFFSARAAPRLTAVVVLPTPPFWLAMVKTVQAMAEPTVAAPLVSSEKEKCGVSGMAGRRLAGEDGAWRRQIARAPAAAEGLEQGHAGRPLILQGGEGGLPGVQLGNLGGDHGGVVDHAGIVFVERDAGGFRGLLHG